MKQTAPRTPQARAQDGFALIVGLLLLVVMSMVGLSMMGTTSRETRMAGGERESNISFQAAEAALRDAEATIDGSTGIDADFDGTTPGQLSLADSEPDFFVPASWSAANSQPYSSGDYPEMPFGGQPRFIIKHIGEVKDDKAIKQSIDVVGYGQQKASPVVSIFRCTARGTGRDGSAVRILQSHFGKQY